VSHSCDSGTAGRSWQWAVYVRSPRCSCRVSVFRLGLALRSHGWHLREASVTAADWDCCWSLLAPTSVSSFGSKHRMVLFCCIFLMYCKWGRMALHTALPVLSGSFGLLTHRCFHFSCQVWHFWKSFHHRYVFSKFATLKFCRARGERYWSGRADLSIVPDSQIFSEWKGILLLDLSGKYTTLYFFFFLNAKEVFCAWGIHS